MNNPLTATDLERFLHRLGKDFGQEGTLYLIGGSALQLLGNPRTTLDIDYVGSDDPPPTDKLAAAIESLAIEMKIDAQRKVWNSPNSCLCQKEPKPDTVSLVTSEN